MHLSHDDAIRQKCEELIASGWTVKSGGANHAVLRTPSGRYQLSVPSKTTYARTRQNFLADAKRFARMDEEFRKSKEGNECSTSEPKPA